MRCAGKGYKGSDVDGSLTFLGFELQVTFLGFELQGCWLDIYFSFSLVQFPLEGRLFDGHFRIFTFDYSVLINYRNTKF